MSPQGSLFGLVVSLVIAGEAVAADAPLLVDPVDYVEVCNAYGDGFFKVPGTDACFRVGTRVRTDYNVFFNFGGDFDFVPGDGFNTTQNDYRFRARGYIYLDARKDTAFGDLRMFSEIRVTRDYANPPRPDLHLAYIALGGLRVGRHQSYYDFTPIRFSQFEFFDPQISRDNPQNLIAYQTPLGEHFGAALSIEDTTGRRDPIASDGVATLYGGAQIPDVVLQLSAGRPDGPLYGQIMGATHYVNTVTQGVGTTSEALGYAIGAGIAGDLPFGDRTRAAFLTSFAHGALNFASTSVSAPFGNFGGPDGVYDAAAGKVELADYLAVAVGARTYVAPQWELALQAGFIYGDLPSAGTDFDNNGAIDDLDFTNTDLQAFLGWHGISGFLVGAGTEYRLVNSADFGSSSFLTTYVRVQATF